MRPSRRAASAAFTSAVAIVLSAAGAGVSPGAKRTCQLRGQANQAPDRIFADGLRLRHLRPAARPLSRQISARRSADRSAKPAGRRIAQPDQLHGQRGAARWHRDRHRRARRCHGADPRCAADAAEIRCDQIHLARQYEQRGRRIFCSRAGPGRDLSGRSQGRADESRFDRSRRRSADLYPDAQRHVRHKAYSPSPVIPARRS